MAEVDEPRVPRAVLLGILAATACLRWRFLAVPLERDEGEYAYMGQLILRGEVPYLAAHNMKLPGTYYAYAGILGLFGETDVAIRVGLLLLNVVSVLLVHRLARRLVDETAGLVAAATYAVLSIGPAVLGFTANAEHFVLPPVLAGALLLVGRPRSAWRLGLGGVLLGLGLVMKQPGAAFVPFGLLAAAVPRDQRSGRTIARDVALVGLAALVPFALSCLAMWAAGAFEPFWFWTVTYAREYATMTPVATGLGELARVGGDVLASMPLVWALALVGVGAVWWDPAGRRARLLLAGFAVCSALAVSLGLRFSEHYFILLLPAASLFTGLAVSALARATSRPMLVGVGVPVVVLASAIAGERAILLELSPAAVSRAIFGINPFPESPAIGKWIHEHTDAGDRLGIVGSEPQLYFYAGRTGATSYIYTYPLMEAHPFAHRMQEEMIAQLERARPRMLVLVSVDTSWTRREESSTAIFEWAARTVDAQYDRVGLIEIARDRPATFRWGDEARNAQPRTRSYVTVFERRG